MHYVKTQNVGKLYKKANAVYEILRPQVEVPEQVVASGKQQDIQKWWCQSRRKFSKEKARYRQPNMRQKIKAKRKSKIQAENAKTLKTPKRQKLLMEATNSRKTIAKKLPRSKKKQYVTKNHTNRKATKVNKRHGANRGLKKRLKIYTPGARSRRAALEPV